jgi:hypothetical protein
VIGGSEDLELVLDLRKVVTGVCVKTLHLDREGHEIVDDLLDDISDTVAPWAVVDWWVEDDISVLQVDPDVEDREQLVVSVVRYTDLVGKVAHGGADTLSDSPDDQAVDVVDVRDPGRGFSVRFDVLEGILE